MAPTTGFSYFTRMTLTLVVILMTLTSLFECRSLPSNPDANVDLSWLPEGMSLEEWDRCYGLPCDEQRKVQTKLHELQMLTLRDENLDDDNIAYDLSQADGSLDGCILLNEQQLDVLINETQEEITNKNKTEEEKSEDEVSRKKRSLTDFRTFPQNKWQKHDFPIRYTFDGKHSESQKNIIRGAIHHWEAQTCIRFEEMKSSPSPSETYIVFSESNYVCHSYVGKQGRGPQPVYLSENCLWSFGIPVHEIFHVLGGWHIHMRTDRDNFVTIHNENLGYYKGQFRTIADAISLGLPYDHASVMHYSPYDGSINGKTVIEAKDRRFQKSMGQRVGLSFYDAMLINTEYCSDICRGQTWKPCQRGGYQDPNNCHKCKCPDGFGGDFCEYVAPSKADPGATCGGELDMPKYMTRVISSPHYNPNHNAFYYDFTECNWLIRVPPGWNVVLKFQDEFGLLEHRQGECFHWVEVKYLTDKQKNGPRYCGSETPNETIVSEDQEMVVIFKSNFSSSNHRANVGFKAIISMVPDILVHRRQPPPPPVYHPPPTPAPWNRWTPAPWTPAPWTPAPRTPAPTTITTTPTPRPTPSPTTREQNPQRHIPAPFDHTAENFLWFCNFETEDGRDTWCNITQEQNDQFDWQIISGQTSSDMTGPDHAFNGHNYIYTEASKPRIYGDKATIRLPRFGRNGQHCLSWRYFMYGYHINTLKVIVEGDGRYEELWQWQGEQEKRQWYSARVTVRLTPWARILFMGSRGLEYSGDIAVDAISLLSGPCWAGSS